MNYLPPSEVGRHRIRHATLMAPQFADNHEDACPASPTVVAGLVESAVAGAPESLEALLNLHSCRIRRMITLRIDRRILGRIGVDDVLQEIHVHVFQHLADYARTPTAPFYIWLRGVAVNVMLELHRRHLGTQMRDAHLEVPLATYPLEASSQAIAMKLSDSGTSPSNAAMRTELRSRLEMLIDSLPPMEKEVLALRHFEQLSPFETAQVLEISEKAAGMRYIRALKKLRTLVGGLPGGLSQWRL